MFFLCFSKMTEAEMENVYHNIGLWHFKEMFFHLWHNHLPGDVSQIRLKKNGICKQHFCPKTQVTFNGLLSGLVKVIFPQKLTQLPECTWMLSGINLRPYSRARETSGSDCFVLRIITASPWAELKLFTRCLSYTVTWRYISPKVKAKICGTVLIHIQFLTQLFTFT